MKQRILAILVSVSMLVAMLPTVAFATYADTKEHWAKNEISKWSDYGILQGSDGLFRPDAPITRGEMAVILDRIMNYQKKASNTFSDLGQAFYTDAILEAAAAGIVKGDGNTVRPNDQISREEAVVMLSRALHLKEFPTKDMAFTDAMQISSWANGHVNSMYKKGYVAGANGAFNPKAYITRAEVIKILNNAIQGFYNKAGEYSSNSDGDVIINTPNVTLKNMEIKGDLIIAEGVGDGEVFLNNVKIQGDTIVKGGGEHSVYFNSVTVEGALIVNKVGGALRIVATGTTSVSVTTLESGAILVTKELTGGGFEKVEIPASVAAGQKIVLSGSFKSVQNDAKDIEMQATGNIEKLVLNQKTNVTGDAAIKSVTTAQGADSVINGKNVSGGQANSSNTGSSATPSTGGSGGGSGGGGGGSNNNAQQAASIVITGTNSITVGNQAVTENYSAKVKNNAGTDLSTQPTITWTIDPQVAGVSVSTTGIVTIDNSKIGASKSFILKAAASSISASKTVSIVSAAARDAAITALNNAQTASEVKALLTDTNAGILGYNFAGYTALGTTNGYQDAVAAAVYNNGTDYTVNELGKSAIATKFNDTVTAQAQAKTDAENQAAVDAEKTKYKIEVSIATTVATNTDITSLLKALNAGETAGNGITVSVAEKADADNYLGGTANAITLAKQAAHDATGNTATVTLTFSKGGKTSSLDVTVTIEKQSSNPTTFTVSFDSKGGSVVAPISNISSGQKITLPTTPTKNAADEQTPLSFLGWFTDDGTFNHEFTSNTTVTASITLYAKWSGWQAPVTLDTRFASGYPKAEVGGDGKLLLKVKLAVAKQTDVFMTVNAMNSGADSDTTAVIHGHAGELNHISDVDKVKYLAINDVVEHEIQTGYQVSTTRDIKVNFVLRDADSTSANPTVVEFAAQASAELDSVAPDFSKAYINAAKDKVFLYFDEPLNPTSVPTASAFVLSNGTVSAVTIQNPQPARIGSVELTVNGITNSSSLTVSYTPPTANALQDSATTPNLVAAFSTQPVSPAVPKAGTIAVSNDGKYLHFELEPAPYYWGIVDPFDIVIQYGLDKGNATPISNSEYESTYSHRNDGSRSDHSIELKNPPGLIPNTKFFIDFVSKNGMKDHAGDDIAPITWEGLPRATTESGIQPTTAVYNTTQKTLTLTWSDGHGLSGSPSACLFTITAGGKNYQLRGHCSLYNNSNSIQFNSDAFPFDFATFDWTNAKISYSITTPHSSVSVHDRLNFDSDKPYDGFADLSITTTP